MPPEPAPFAYDGLDRVMHEKARLGILTSLAGHPEGLSFNDLLRLCGLTQGNMSRHLSVLEEAGLVAISKGFEARRPRTDIRLTAEGRRRFLDYLSVLEQVIRDASAKIEPTPAKPARNAPADGWWKGI
ncbi:transcriptional regulator [Devosia sp. CN2-171]|uniref:transcriptional regulator n=1 Tax=Devosia sp. CN2-171 TaxID=3400909 RepID=UPI003BF9074A